jgi:hypothetical protein
MKSKTRALILFLLTLSISTIALAQGSRYSVQLGATQAQAEAESKVNELRANDVQAYIVRSEVPGKGVFYRIRVGVFADMNAAKKYGADLVRKGVTPDFFVAAFEQPMEGKVPSIKPAAKPVVAQQAKTAAPITSDPAPTTTPKNSPAPVSSAPTPVTTNAPAPAAAAVFSRYQDPSVGYSFEYPNYWTGQTLDPKDAADQRVNAGALFKSSEDSAFLNAIWNKLEKANSQDNDNDLIVEIILKSMSSGEGTQLKETSRKVVSENGVIKTFLDLKAAFQSPGQPTPLDFFGKAIIIRANKGILLVVAFYSKDASPNSGPIADRIIASVKAPE